MAATHWESPPVVPDADAVGLLRAWHLAQGRADELELELDYVRTSLRHLAAGTTDRHVRRQVVALVRRIDRVIPPRDSSTR